MKEFRTLHNKEHREVIMDCACGRYGNTRNTTKICWRNLYRNVNLGLIIKIIIYEREETLRERMGFKDTNCTTSEQLALEKN
jgi:hypothetical protein